jgi:hypothetical protein
MTYCNSRNINRNNEQGSRIDALLNYPPTMLSRRSQPLPFASPRTLRARSNSNESTSSLLEQALVIGESFQRILSEDISSSNTYPIRQHEEAHDEDGQGDLLQ